MESAIACSQPLVKISRRQGLGIVMMTYLSAKVDWRGRRVNRSEYGRRKRSCLNEGNLGWKNEESVD